MNKTTKINVPSYLPKIIESLVQRDFEKLENIKDVYKINTDTENKRLHLLINSKLKKGSNIQDDDIDTMIDEINSNSVNEKLLDALLIIGLYRVVEIKSKLILSQIYEENVVDKFSDWLLLNLQLEKNKVLRLYTLKMFKDINLLRLLNNCVKHTHKVNPELSKITGLPIKISIDTIDLMTYFNHLKPKVIEYLKKLAIAAITYGGKLNERIDKTESFKDKKHKSAYEKMIASHYV